MTDVCCININKKKRALLLLCALGLVLPLPCWIQRFASTASVPPVGVPPASVALDAPKVLRIESSPEMIDSPMTPAPEQRVALLEPPHRWVLSDSTWKAMADGRVQFDLDVVSDKPYVGVRFVLPF
jgi:hypothetical protein